jgi:hypothetical protein
MYVVYLLDDYSFLLLFLNLCTALSSESIELYAWYSLWLVNHFVNLYTALYCTLLSSESTDYMSGAPCGTAYISLCCW